MTRPSAVDDRAPVSRSPAHLVSHVHRVADIDLAQDLEFAERNWRFQSIGRWLMFLVILGALGGLFGRGPAARAVVGGRGAPFEMEYDRFTRHASPTHLRIRLAPGAAPEGRVRLWIGRDYLRQTRIETVLPEPESVESGPAGVVYVFAVKDPAAPARIQFDVEPEGYWSRAGEIGLDGKPAYRFSQFVFP